MKPLGYYVLIEVEVVEEVSEGGIILSKDVTGKEQAVMQKGWIRGIGPTAWAGYPGCEKTRPVKGGPWKDVQATEDVPPHECWGVQVGDKVSFEKYAGQRGDDIDVEGYENFRLVPDSKINSLLEREGEEV